MPDTISAPLAPAAVRYIKLGEGGCWEAASLENGTIEFGFSRDSHALAASGDWAALQAQYIAQGVSPGTATRYANELRTFYAAGADTLWITFARGYLWWAYADPEVIDRGGETRTEGSRYRRTIGPWRNTDITGVPLAMHTLSTRLTQMAAYRGTICAVAEEAYLLGRLNAMPQPAVARVIAARTELADAIAGLIPLLHWAEFELLVDLLFTRSGWRRVTELGGTMKDIDLLVEQPVTGERIAVQVKSKANQAVLDACAEAHAASGLADRFYFVCHSPSGPLVAPTGGKGRVMLWRPAEIALAAVDAGLADWLIAKAA